MAFDAAARHDPSRFVAWAKGGECPYASVKYQRACNFREQRDLYYADPSPRAWDLMVALIREKCANSDYH